MYDMRDTECDVSNQMTREGMILFGLLSGADYSKVRMCFLLCSCLCH
jgi:hypothetical protein